MGKKAPQEKAPQAPRASASRKRGASDASAGSASSAGEASEAGDASSAGAGRSGGSAAGAGSSPAPPPAKKPRPSKLAASSLAYSESLSLRGVVYVGRVPPKLTVSKFKTLLSDHGEVTRVYLEEEDRAKRKRRKRAGGGGGKRYTEGWAEFSSKRHAKAAARGLHMTSMERKGTHSEDLWSLRYLKGFKWDMLTEKVAYERRVREQKLRVEMAGAGRQKKEFEARIEEGERFEAMERRRGKLEMGGGEFKREFRQKKVLED